MEIYNFKVKWYVKNEESGDYLPQVDYGIIVAGSFGDAVSRIEAHFPETDTIDIHYIDTGNMVFTNDVVYNKLNNEDYSSGDYIIGE